MCQENDKPVNSDEGIASDSDNNIDESDSLADYNKASINPSESLE